MKILDIISLCKPVRPSDLKNPVGAKVIINPDPLIFSPKKYSYNYLLKLVAKREIGTIVDKPIDLGYGISGESYRVEFSDRSERWRNDALEVIEQ